MQRIDAHQHFWKFNPVRDAWINDDMPVLRNDFLPEQFLPLLQQNNIDGCIAVQAGQSETETDFLLELAAKYDFIKAVVGWVDLQATNIEERLEHYAAFKKLKGFRHIVQAEPQDDFLLSHDFCNGISLLKKFGFTYDILVYPKHLSYVLKFVKRFPEQKFVIDHCAKPDIKNDNISEWKEWMKEIARHPNVYCKLSGLFTEANWKEWRTAQFFPYLDVVFESFGTERLMFGSDWPVMLLAGTYVQWKNILELYMGNYNAEDRKKVFGQNAINFYGL